MNGDIQGLLKRHFPWLGTDQPAGDAGDLVDALNKVYTLCARKTAIVHGRTHKHLQCPYCEASTRDGNTFRYVEDIQNHRDVIGFADGKGQRGGPVLKVEGHYESGEGYDDGADGRLECRSCYEECSVPDSVEIDWR